MLIKPFKYGSSKITYKYTSDKLSEIIIYFGVRLLVELLEETSTLSMGQPNSQSGHIKGDKVDIFNIIKFLFPFLDIENVLQENRKWFKTSPNSHCEFFNTSMEHVATLKNNHGLLYIL